MRGACIAITAAVAASPAAFAKPDRPENAAHTNSGKGCLVRDANGTYHYDPDCNWRSVVRYDRDEVLVLVNYQDKGNLPAGAPRPKSAIRNTEPWPGCLAPVIDEWTKPSGEYSSYCHFRK